VYGGDHVRSRRRAWLVGLVAVALTAAFAIAAIASTSTTTVVSTGPAGGNGPLSSYFAASSRDGSQLLFASDESLVAEDTDTARDLYQRAGGTTTLVSVGPNGGNDDNFGVESGEMSPDGARVFFETGEHLVSADTDAQDDIYERAGGVTTLLSTGPAGGNGDFGVDLKAWSDDGSRVFMRTEEPLVAADTDAQADIYERSGGTTALVSTGPAGGNGDAPADFGDVSADGTRVFFTTTEQLVAADTDSQYDAYERSNGATTLVSTGPAGGNGAFSAFEDGISPDGTHVFVETAEPLTADDTDASVDIYERSGGTTTLVSTGPAGGNGSFDASFQGSRVNGGRVFFDTAESLVPSDTDLQVDVYEHSGGATTLVSGGGNGAFAANYSDASADGSRAFFYTAEPLVPADSDNQIDVYQRWRGATTLVSTGPAGGNGPFQADFLKASADGRRVFFYTDESLVAGDTDSVRDVYERSGGDTTLLSTGTSDANVGFAVDFGDASADGTLMFFGTQEPLVPEDTDTRSDVYEASISAPPADPDEPVPDDHHDPPVLTPDSTAPNTKITRRPHNRTRKPVARFGFTSTEAGSSFQCKVDRKRFVPCTSPRRFRARTGRRHTFRVRAIDAAGNVDATPALDRWTVLRKHRR
jgi:hypothetical protein